MMSFLRKFLLSVGGFALVVVLLGLLLPSSAHIEREIVVEAPRATVFGLVNDFRQINKWSLWRNDDPNARFEIAGPPRGVDASMSWEGSIVGQGRQVITESIPYERVSSRLELGSRPPATRTFVLTDDERGTLVTRSFDTEFGLNLVNRFLGLTLKRTVGEDFERGLASLKTMAESMPRSDFSAVEIEHVTIEATDIALLPVSSEPEPGAIAKAMRDAYFDILGFIDRNGLQEAGSAISISRGFSGSRIRFDAAIPVYGATADSPRDGPGVRVSRSYTGPVIRVRHIGPYRTLGSTHDKIAAYLAALGIQRNGNAWESYVSDPTRVDEAELLTYVYYPIRDAD